ncbi:hypothetical protein H257_16648 [Aphanomyces astaci]|uniref:PH domain-containing protein n=4 Tax=Aphanomyces astaci TaxID=112090 RepID=W4FHY5_APHAT|nr:hypothetical protein H257_16648 [Aphanomyces astaci]ETV67107.1 hypothetical protein H257_16648 [Aphanomyces astaci]|eukprot:XP_009843476.1 hypothetical protein H257_16648 [Aphanomyces astaci]
MEGVLWKRGKTLVSSWHERYFVLKDATLAYFSKAGDLQTRGMIELTTDAHVSAIELKKKHSSKSLYCFSIFFLHALPKDHHQPAGFMVGCESREYATCWRNAIIHAIDNTDVSVDHHPRSPTTAPATAASSSSSSSSSLRREPIHMGQPSSTSSLDLQQQDVGRRELLAKMDRKWPMFRGTYDVCSVVGGMTIHSEQRSSKPAGSGDASASSSKPEWQSWQQLNSLLVSAISVAVISFVAGGIGGISIPTSFAFALAAAGGTLWLRSADEDEDVPSFKASRVVPGTPLEVFRLLVDTSVRGLWDGAVDSMRVLQTLDAHSDIVHIVFKPVWLWPLWLPASDACLLRYWRETEDGSYVLCVQSAVHAECPVTDHVRVLCQGGGVTVSPRCTSSASTSDVPTSLVSMVVHANPQGLFGAWMRRMHVVFQYIQPQLLALIGLEEAMEARKYMALAHDAATDEDEYEDSAKDGQPAARKPVEVAMELPTCMPRHVWSEPPVGFTMVRGPDYMTNRKKVASAAPAFRLAGVDIFETGAVSVEHICARPDNVMQTVPDQPFAFVLNFLLPGPPKYSLVLYYHVPHPSVLTDGSPFAELMTDFLDGTDEYRNERFKLIPSIVEGNFIVKQAVGSTPAVIGNKLRQPYFKTPKYFELDIDVTSSAVANRVTGLVLGFTKKLIVDMSFLVEGKHGHELPERLFGACRLSFVDMAHAKKLV